MKQAHSLEELESLIHSGAWPVGTKLPAERALSSQLNCSRAALREHLQKLQACGLIQIKRGAGSVVSEAAPSPLLSLLAQSPRSRQELLAVRTALDGLAAQGAATLATDRELAAIRKQHRHFADAVTSRDSEAMGRYDAGFHLAIAAASHNKVLVEVVRSLREALEASIAISSSRLFEQVNFGHSVLEQHSEIVAAIGRREPESAKAAAERHVVKTAQRLQAQR